MSGILHMLAEAKPEKEDCKFCHVFDIHVYSVFSFIANVSGK